MSSTAPLEPPTPTTLATVVSCIAATLKGVYAIDPLPVIRSVGIDPAVMQDSEKRLPLSVLRPLWLRCVELTGDEAFGLRAARFYQPAQFYGVDLAFCAGATFGQALERHVHNIRVLTTVATPILTTEPDGDFRLAVLQNGALRPTDAALDCFFYGIHIRLFERHTGMPAEQLLRRLELPRKPPHDPAPWLSYGVPVTFERPCALVFKAQAWDLPLPGANPGLLMELEQPILQQLAHLGLPLPTRALCARLTEVLTSDPSLEGLARMLVISPALLRANLTRQGVSFPQLLDQSRAAQALVLLADPSLSLEQVASRIGLSSASSFTRAFRRWHGETPLRYRRRSL